MFESIARELSGLKEEEYMTNKEEIIPQLTQLLKETLIAIPDETIGIAFSGGLDSSLLAILAQQTGKKFKPYTVGLPNAEDVDYAGRIALQMHWPVKIKILTPDEATTTIQEVTTILSNTHQDVSPTHVGIGAVVYSVLQMAKQDGIKTVIGGLSAEELFAG
ncbi:TPA: asparagine synthase [Candidatus Woesearchaeota archaeon]|nr:asparagine synthase [Candidatus Woesearchaeota archaeon]